MQDLIKLQKKTQTQAQLNQTLENRNASLLAEIKGLKKGDHALEEQARQALGMVREDETYYQIIDAQGEQKERH